MWLLSQQILNSSLATESSVLTKDISQDVEAIGPKQHVCLVISVMHNNGGSPKSLQQIYNNLYAVHQMSQSEFW